MPSSSGVGIRQSEHRMASLLTGMSATWRDAMPGSTAAETSGSAFNRDAMRSSSAMISLQTPTHSSQMKTAGPAMSLRTWSAVFWQKEHRSAGSDRIARSRFLLSIVFR